MLQSPVGGGEVQEDYMISRGSWGVGLKNASKKDLIIDF